MDDSRIADLRDEVNRLIVAEGLEFGPLRIRRRRPAVTTGDGSGKDLLVTDGNGRRCAVDGDPTAVRVVEHATARHENRRELDAQILIERRAMADALGAVARGRIDVVPTGMMDARRDSFMVFEVTLDLLDDALAWRPHRLTWQPYGKGAGDDPWATAARQRRRLKALGGDDRMHALSVCRVLAARIRDADNPCSWSGMISDAMEGRPTPDVLRFRDGTLRGPVELGTSRNGARWSEGRLSLPDMLPDTVAKSLAGRRLRDVVDHRHLPEDAVVRSATRKGGRTVVAAVCGTEPLLPLLVGTMERALEARPELDRFPGRKAVLARIQRDLRRIKATAAA